MLLPARPGAARMPSAEPLEPSPLNFGVVGLGQMARALLFPLIEAGLIEAPAVRAVVASQASAERLASSHGLAVGTDPAGP